MKKMQILSVVVFLLLATVLAIDGAAIPTNEEISAALAESAVEQSWRAPEANSLKARKTRQFGYGGYGGYGGYPGFGYGFGGNRFNYRHRGYDFGSRSSREFGSRGSHEFGFGR